MNKDEALDLALEVLEYIDLCDNDRDFLHPHECFQLDKAITAIKQARSAPVQQPVAYIDKYGEIYKDVENVLSTDIPLYTTPPAAQRSWVGLSEEELQKILQEVSGQGWKPMLEAIEAKLKEKNT